MEKQLIAWILGVLGLSGASAAQAGLMPTEVEGLDGNQRDLAGPADVTALEPGDERIYTAQGRRMAMHIVESRERQFDGEPTNFATELTAVEIDEARNLMFVLTGDVNTGEPDPVSGLPIVIPGKLGVYDITIPADPNPLSEVPLGGTDIRVIPDDEKLLLIHQVQHPTLPPQKLWRVTVFDYEGATTLTEIQHVNLPTDPPLRAETCPQDPLERNVVALSRAVVQVDDGNPLDPLDDIRRVFLLATIQHTRVDVGLQKGATGIVALSLNPDPLQPPYVQPPAFYPDVWDVFDAYPCPVPTHPISGAVVPPREYAVTDLQLVKQGANWFLCAVGAKEHGAKVFAIANFESAGFDRYFERVEFGPSGVKDDLVAVDAVGTDLAILSRNYSIAAPLTLITSFLNPTPFGQGPPRDTVVMKEGSPGAPQTKLWSMTAGTGADYRFKIQDVSSLAAAPVLEETYYGPGAFDTAVYVPELDSVYCTSFHGVVRYDVSLPPDAVPDYDSYSPTPGTPGTVPPSPIPVEHMVAVEREPEWDIYTRQLFAQSAIGGFHQWGLDPVTREPHYMDFVDGVAAGAWPNWASDPTYGRDIQYGIDPNNGHEILILDYYNMGTQEIAINLYDLTAESWGGAYLLGPKTGGGDPLVKPVVWDLALDDRWVFVAGETGFYVAELVADSPTSRLELRDHALTFPGTPVGGFSFTEVQGIARVNDRVFVSLADAANRFALAAYTFDAVTGAIGSAPLAVRFDGAGTQPDDFPGLYLTGGGRLHAFTHGAQTQLFSCTQNGYVVQMAYTSPNVLTSQPVRYWHNGAYYTDASDCQVTNLAAPGSPPDLRLTVSKWNESFAIVVPFAF